MVYAPVDVAGMQSAMRGCNPSDVAVLPSGISVMRDSLDESSPVISTSPDRATKSGGSLVTIAFQLLADSSPEAKVTMDSAEAACSLISSAIINIKKAMRCDDS